MPGDRLRELVGSRKNHRIARPERLDGIDELRLDLFEEKCRTRLEELFPSDRGGNSADENDQK